MKGKISAFFRRIFLPNFSKICGGVRKRRDTRKFPSRDTSELRATVDPRIPFAPVPAKPAIRQESDIKGEVCVCGMRTCWPKYSKIGGGVWKLRDTRKFHESIYGYGRQISGSPVEIWPSLTHRR